MFNLKICFVHEEYPDETNFGGIATYQKLMAEYYANHGDDVIVVARGNHDKNYFENNVHVYRIGASNDSNSIKSVKEYRKKVSKLLLNLQNSNKIDIIETPDWGANTIYFEKYRKVPLVVRLHTPLKIWLKYNNNNFGKATNLILEWENHMLKKSDMLISCSELLKKNMMNEYSLNKEIFILPNPYNNKDFNNLNYKENSNIIFIGSLEERKGAINFAKALNIILKKKQSINVYIVGKDTTRNNKNISTKKYMLDIIDNKFYDRIKFIGQVDNAKVNYYLNIAKLAVFPSIFDNFPYVVLEAMSTGKYIICSDNMGVTNLVENNSYNFIFNSHSYKDMAKKICKFYKIKTPYINRNNIDVVRSSCNQKIICEKMKSYYKIAIKNYNKKIEKNILYSKILKMAGVNDKILSIEKLKYNLANDVFKVRTVTKKYIIKKYNYEYDFNLSNMLYDLYNKNNFNVVKPINEELIVLYGNNYNVFNYIHNSKVNISDDFFVDLINCDRKIDMKSNLNDKCNKYYNYLVKLKIYKLNEEKKILDLYNEIRDYHLFSDTYLNHGDLSKSNILFCSNKYYLIDFDETIITTELYDFANIVVKNKVKNNKFQINDIKYMINSITNNKYSFNDYIISIKYYLCKILLEKFYLYEIGKIDLFENNQIQDNFKNYIYLLDEISKLEEN